jgi:hypothetical protein
MIADKSSISARGAEASILCAIRGIGGISFSTCTLFLNEAMFSTSYPHLIAAADRLRTKTDIHLIGGFVEIL